MSNGHVIGGSRDRKTVGCYLPANRNIMFDIVDDPVLCVLRKATLSEGPAAQSGNVNVYNKYFIICSDTWTVRTVS